MPKNKREICVADCETDPFKAGRLPSPFLWGWYNGEDYREFESHADLIAFLRERHCICYAHNGGRFDWHFILPYVEEMTEVTLINGRIAKMPIGQCEFRDSWNILPVPLAAYQKTEIDYGIFEKERRYIPGNFQRIRDYLRDDCVFLYELVSQFNEEFGRNLTIAGTAMKLWRKIRPDFIQDDGWIYEKLAPYYYGGRCQAIRPGMIEEPFQFADINSAYPFAMLHRHPFQPDCDDVSPAQLARLPDDLLAPAFVRVRCRSAGAFPFRLENGSLAFPDDDEIREYTVTGHEFIAAQDTGALDRVEVLGGIVFSELCDFREYIERFYSLRMQAKARGDKARVLFYKLLMNSLYGKFAANPDSYREFVTLDSEVLDGVGEIDDEDGRVWKYAGEFGRWCLASTELPEDRRRFYNLGTGASITGFVRALMWRALKQVREPIYCDTDSIAALDVSGLDYGDALGQWSLEGEFSRGGVAGKKLYAFKDAATGKWKTASKGVRLSAPEILRVAQGETVTYTPEVPVYSVHKAPHFQSRTIRATELDTQKKRA